MRWSVGVEAEAGRVLTREEVVELADAVAVCDGIATGIGTSRYGAQLIVRGAGGDEAIEKVRKDLSAAATKAGLPPGPIVRAEATSEADETDAAAPDGAPGIFVTGEADG